MKKNNILIAISLIIIMLISSCLKEDHFGLSSEASIIKFEVLSQIGKTSIDKDNMTVTVEMAGKILMANAIIEKLELSSFAKSKLEVWEVIDLSDSMKVNITAEDGTIKEWTIIATEAASQPQIRNSDLDHWFQTSSGYFEPEINSDLFLLSPRWSSNNAASHSIGIIPVVPLEIQNNNFAARIETMDNGDHDKLYGRISPGKLFTGKFSKLKHKRKEPASGIDNAIEFIGKPKSVTFSYKYKPGEVNLDADGNLLGYLDAAEIYVFLEVRDSTGVKRLATAWFRTQSETTNLTGVNVDFEYGKLFGTYPDYLKPENGKYVPLDSIGIVFPTHLSFMANSSFKGDELAGAIGSVLVVDDIKFKY